MIIIIGNPDIDNLSVLNNAIPVLTYDDADIRLLHWDVSLRTNQFDIVSRTDLSWKKE